MQQHKIIIAGGTGFLGRTLINKLNNGNTQIVVLTRDAASEKDGVRYVNWDGKTLLAWTSELEGATAVINLAGKSVNCRYTARNRREMTASRTDATYIIGKAIQTATHPPKVWINAGSAAIFGNSGDIIKAENDTVGEGFSTEICKKWEAAFSANETPGTRKVLLRIGLVFQKNTGLLQPFVKLVKFGLGGTMGSGNQYISWIHENDFLAIIEAAIQRDDIYGTIHASSPAPVTNRHFLQSLRKVIGVPFGLPNPAFLLKAGALFIGTEAHLILSGRRVVSHVLEEKGFKFRYPLLEDALKDLVV